MRILDFIQEKSDCMNETDFFGILDTLTDAYGNALHRCGIHSTGSISEQALLHNFFLQEIKKAADGSYVFVYDPGKAMSRRK